MDAMTAPSKERTSRPPWGHASRHCVHCGKVGPRIIVIGGYSHKRCLTPNDIKLRAPTRQDKEGGRP